MKFNWKRSVLQQIRKLCNNNDKLYYQIHYVLKFNKPLSFNRPVTFNEKIHWLKLYDRNPIYSTIVDKYAVREYIKNKIGEQYLIDLIGVYKSTNEIDFKKLPASFVMKATHGSGWVIICKNKIQLHWSDALNDMNYWLSKNFYTLWGEWPYKNVQPGIICEKFLNASEYSTPNDYKIYCFNGKPEFLHVDIGRFKNPTRTFFSLEWEELPFQKVYPKNSAPIPKPECLSEMIEIAQKLSENIPFVRVDLYEVNKKVYFGELTLYPMNGLSKFKPEKYNKIIGSYLQLPNKYL